MKSIKFLATMFSAFMVTACGGGSSGSENPQPTKIDNQPTPAVTAQEANTTAPTENTNSAPQQDTPRFIEVRELPKGIVKTQDVGVGKIVGYNNQYSFNGAWKEMPEENIVVDGTKMLITKSLKMAGLTGNPLYQALTAAWNATMNNPNREMLYFGDETPKSVIDNLKGKATYQGVATRYDNVTADVKNIGKSTLNADFDTKKVDGLLEIDGLWRRNISLKEADIVGNGFEGKAVAGENHILTTREGKYEGKFYGPNAEEVAGKAFFEGEAYIGKLKDLDTSFSAVKQ